MIIQIPNVLDAATTARCREALNAARWIDGRATAGHQSAQTKDNEQLPEDHPLAREWGDTIVAALERNPLFVSAALPLKVFSPLFNRYAGGQSFGVHVDNAVRMVPGTGLRVRTDLSATLFLAEPETYDGGELSVEDTFGVHHIKLPAGHMVLYPASSLHRVAPVRRGVRLASFFWVQSMIRDDAQRTLLFDLDRAIQKLNAAADHAGVAVPLTGTYHNLLRMWADA